MPVTAASAYSTTEKSTSTPVIEKIAARKSITNEERIKNIIKGMLISFGGCTALHLLGKLLFQSILRKRFSEKQCQVIYQKSFIFSLSSTFFHVA